MRDLGWPETPILAGSKENDNAMHALSAEEIVDGADDLGPPSFERVR